MVSSAAMSGKIDSPYIVSLELKARKSLFTTSFSSFSSSTTFLIVFVPTQFSAASLQNSSPSSTTFRCFLKNVATGEEFYQETLACYCAIRICISVSLLRSSLPDAELTQFCQYFLFLFSPLSPGILLHPPLLLEFRFIVS